MKEDKSIDTNSNKNNNDNDIIFFDFTKILNMATQNHEQKVDEIESETKKTNYDDSKAIKYIRKNDINLLYTIDGLISLCNKYKNLNNPDIQKLILIENDLTEINNLIGMTNLKNMLCKQILYFIQICDKDVDSKMLFNTVLYGEPGSGKTTVAKIMGNIFLKLGYLKNNKFVIAKRSDLVAGYLGQTALKTQKLIDKAEGGVLFIDEVYSLGSSSTTDSFSKECIDTLNQNLSEKNFICIIAGYEKDIKEHFFSKNSGLERRFPWVFTIDKNTPHDLYLIFLKILNENDFYFMKKHTDKLIQFFSINHSYFKYNGGSLKNFFDKLKIHFFQSSFGRKKNNNKKTINIDHIYDTFKIYKKYENKCIDKPSPPPFGMYM